jgi:hypothetical protein
MRTVIVYPTNKQILVSNIDYDKYIFDMLLDNKISSFNEKDKSYHVKVREEVIKFIFDYELNSLINPPTKSENIFSFLPVIETELSYAKSIRKLDLFTQVRRSLNLIGREVVLLKHFPIAIICLYQKGSDLFEQANSLHYPIQNLPIHIYHSHMDRVADSIIDALNEHHGRD